MATKAFPRFRAGDGISVMLNTVLPFVCPSPQYLTLMQPHRNGRLGLHDALLCCLCLCKVCTNNALVGATGGVPSLPSFSPKGGGGGGGNNPATTSTSSIRQLLGAADTQTAHQCHIQHSPNTPTTGLRERGNDTSKSTGRSGRQNAAIRRNMRREERVTVQGPVKEQQPDGMSHRGGGVNCTPTRSVRAKTPRVQRTVGVRAVVM